MMMMMMMMIIHCSHYQHSDWPEHPAYYVVLVCSRRVLMICFHVHLLWINLLIEFSSKTDKGNITKKKLIRYLCLSLSTSSTVVIIVSKWGALVWRKTDFGQSIWPDGGHLATAFTILNCLENEFLKGFLVQGRQQSFWKLSIHSNILDLQWCRPNKWKIHSQLSTMFTCRDGKGGKLSSQASKMLYKPPGAVSIASYKEPVDQSDCWKLFVQLWNYTNSHYTMIYKNGERLRDFWGLFIFIVV